MTRGATMPKAVECVRDHAEDKAAADDRAEDEAAAEQRAEQLSMPKPVKRVRERVRDRTDKAAKEEREQLHKTLDEAALIAATTTRKQRAERRLAAAEEVARERNGELLPPRSWPPHRPRVLIGTLLSN